MVAGLLRPDSGSVSVLGIDALDDPVAAKQITAWVSDEPMIYDKLTPLEYLAFVAGLWGIDPQMAQRSAQDLLVSLGLAPHLHERGTPRLAAPNRTILEPSFEQKRRGGLLPSASS
jgi:ABC-2 type transport system ATP-binding protein